MKKYFLSANTCEGYVNFYPEESKKLSRVYTLTGVSDLGVCEVIKNAAKEFFADKLILNPSNPEMVYGCIIKDIGIFGEGMKKTIYDDENYKGLYYAYKKAKKVHDEWEKIYVSNMDIKQLNNFCKNIEETILADKKGTEKGVDSIGFFGASTPEKPINYINELTKNIRKRYFIKGRPGTGKSTFLKKVRAKANEQGFNTETYYCSFDPNSLDMVVIPELSVCVFDSTAPHELFPVRKNDEILDFYLAAGLLGTDEKYKKELSEISEEYSKLMNEGKEYLKKIRTSQSEGVVCENKAEIYDSVREFLLKI